MTARKHPTATVDSLNEIVPPLDYSFLSLANATETLSEDPRSSPRKSKTKKTESGKSESRCLRLNNNTLTDCSNLLEVSKDLFERPEDVAWIDLSMNDMTKIDPVLTQFTGLQILYLHGNQIANIKEIEKLGALPNLRKLTLHGNGVEKEKGYRQYVLAHLPTLQVLDFSNVTKADKATAKTWFKMNVANKKTKRPRDED